MKNGVVEYQKTNSCLPEIVLLNIPRSFNSDYLYNTGVEEVKDMFFYSGKYEGGMVDGNSPHLIIFLMRNLTIRRCLWIVGMSKILIMIFKFSLCGLRPNSSRISLDHLFS